MIQEEILEYNKRCAEFLGAIYSEDAQAWGFGNAKYIGSKMLYGVMYHDVIEAERFEKQLKFDSDWNWIMEVVEAIQKIIIIEDDDEFCIEFYEGLPGDPKTFVTVGEIEISNKNPKEAVVQAIDQFLIRYNDL
jgi:hypothetical protein